MLTHMLTGVQIVTVSTLLKLVEIVFLLLRRMPAKMELVRELSMDSILYMPGPEMITSTTDTSKAASINRVLRKIYPRGTTPKVTDLIAFLDDDQVLPQCLSLLAFC